MAEALRCDGTSAVVDPEDGGRLVSLRAYGLELLARAGPEPYRYGSFVMAPYAGRVRDARLHYRGQQVELPRTLPPHAGLGLVLDRPWQVTARDAVSVAMQCRFDDRWPFGGRVLQSVVLRKAGVDLAVRVEADQHSFPATVGWHPWFARHLGGAEVEIGLSAAAMLRRDASGIATDERVPVRPGPWDDCFVAVDWPVRAVWPTVLELEVRSNAACVVVYDEHPAAVCVEPQTGPPDAVNAQPFAVSPGTPLLARASWRWRLMS